MKSLAFKLALAAVALSTLVVFVYFFQKQQKLNDLKAKEQRTQEELQRVREADLEMILKADVDTKELSKSLKRYSSQNLAGAEEYIQHYIDDPRAEIRAAALEASGAFDWANLQLFEQALIAGGDAQRSALVGLQKRPSGERLELLKSHRKSISDINQFEYLMAIYKMEPDPEHKAVLLKSLLKLATKNKADLIELFNLPVKDEALLLKAKEELINTGYEELATACLVYLSNYEPSWISENIFNIPFHESISFQANLVDYLRENCPANWELMVNELKKSKIARVHELLEEAQLQKICK